MKSGLFHLLHEDEAYAEAQKRIRECLETKATKLDFSFRKKIMPREHTEFMGCLKEIPPEIVELEFLTELDLSGIRLTKIPDFIGSLSSLKKLSLGADILELPEWLGNFKNLKILEIDNNNIKTVPLTLTNLRKLRELRLHGNMITSIPEGFGENQSLIYLDLQCQQLKALPKSFNSLKSLKHFCLKAAGITTIPDSLGGCPLEYIELSGKYKTIPESFTNLSKLNTLKLSSPELETLPESLGNLSSLRELHITSDKLSVLPQSLCDLKELEEICLDTFSLNELPCAFGDLYKLKKIDIFSGRLTELPESIGNLKNLKSIHLDVYNLASIPDSFNKLTYIKKMDIQTSPKPLVLPCSKKKKDTCSLVELAEIKNKRYREKLLDTYSIKQLESFLLPEDPFFHLLYDNYEGILQRDKELCYDIMEARRNKLNREFRWTDENKKRIANVSDNFMKAWEDGFFKAKTIIETLYEKETDKDSFDSKYNFEIVLNPLEQDDGVFCTTIINEFDSLIENLLSMNVQYNPVTKCEDSFRNALPMNCESNWNTESLSGIALNEHRICWAVNILSNYWALADIARINFISAEVKLVYRLEGNAADLRCF